MVPSSMNSSDQEAPPCSTNREPFHVQVRANLIIESGFRLWDRPPRPEQEGTPGIVQGAIDSASYVPPRHPCRQLDCLMIPRMSLAHGSAVTVTDPFGPTWTFPADVTFAFTVTS